MASVAAGAWCVPRRARRAPRAARRPGRRSPASGRCGLLEHAMRVATSSTSSRFCSTIIIESPCPPAERPGCRPISSTIEGWMPSEVRRGAASTDEHQRARERQHLLLTARQRAAAAVEQRRSAAATAPARDRALPVPSRRDRASRRGAGSPGWSARQDAAALRNIADAEPVRACAGHRVTSTPSIKMRPPVTGSMPIMAFSSVVLPMPFGRRCRAPRPRSSCKARRRAAPARRRSRRAGRTPRTPSPAAFLGRVVALVRIRVDALTVRVPDIDLTHVRVGQHLVGGPLGQDRPLMKDRDGRIEHADEMHVVIDDDERRGPVDLPDDSTSRSISAPVMPAAGSSSSTSQGFLASTMPISTSCRWPCASSPTLRRTIAPDRARRPLHLTALARSWPCARRAASHRFSSTVRPFMTEGTCVLMPTPRRTI